MPITRPVFRIALAAGLAATMAGCSQSPPATPEPPATAEGSATATTTPESVDVTTELESLEQEFDTRIGVSALDTATGSSVAHRADERFDFASTLKLFAAAELLRQVPADERESPITWSQADVDAAGYSPVTGEQVDDGLTLLKLAEAAVRDSDNTAMNLVLDRLGGPAGLQSGLVELGDSTTEVAGEEPELNVVVPGDRANTTTPAAFTANLQVLLETDALSPDDRDLLIDWMSGNATGDPLVRAGAPAGRVVADKSGGAGAMRNDVAIVTPPGREPILLTVLTEKLDPEEDYDDVLVAQAARVVLTELE